MKKCANPECGKRLTPSQIQRGNDYCSGRCATRLQFGNPPPGKDVAIREGDRWEKVAPHMSPNDATRNWEIRSIFFEELNRGE